MWYKKQGFPEEREIVLCTVKKILNNSVFVDLDEYEGKEGIIHISEIAPGRIRTIKEYVREGKKIVCLVLRVNSERGNIELSLRRVTKSVTTEKNQELKKESNCEKILEIIAEKHKIKKEELIKKIGIEIIKKYGSIYACFKEVIEKSDKGIREVIENKKVVEDLVELIKARLRPAEIKLVQIIKLRSTKPDGIERIRGLLRKIKEMGQQKQQKVEIKYIGAPNYRTTIQAADYKKAEQLASEITKFLETEAKKSGCEAETILKK